MASGGGTIVWESDTLNPGLIAFPVRLAAALWTLMEFNETKVQDHMRSTAPWTDRTGNARQGLFAKAFKDAGEVGIVAYHTMPYGIWLEVKHEGQYAVITPTVPLEGARIMQEVSKLITAMRAV